ncbi:MAG: hypothetical protein JSV49_04275 [Thermoplasmata archaeon]|nr:MAG: hypothetical protein JSV49_04275 [Thermoplasmata archaeon]
MTFTKFPNGVSSYGMPDVGGAHLTTGNVFFVDSNTGSNSYDGKDKDHPFATITHALTKCTNNKGDIIYAMPGHVEAADVNVNKAGVNIIGIGQGGLRPQFYLGTNTSASLEISSCDVYIENFIITSTSTLDAIAHCVEVKADHFTMKNCEYWQHSASNTPAIVIDVSSTALNCTIDSCKLVAVGTCAGGVALMQIDGGDNLTLNNTLFYGPAGNVTGSSHGLISVSSAGSLENTFIKDCIFITAGNSSLAGAGTLGFTTGQGTGVVIHSYFGNRATTNHIFTENEAQTMTEYDLVFFDVAFANQTGVRAATSAVWGMAFSAST